MPSRTGTTYKDAGVDLEAGERALALMRKAVRRTYGPEVLAGIGAFGGLFDARRLTEMEQPVLVASTDGVGTKTKVAAELGAFSDLGEDIVHHCLNDILAQGATPLFFLDYVAASWLQPEVIAEVVVGAARACERAGVTLLGGETAEMPGVYTEGALDVVGTIVGAVERAHIVDGHAIQAGDIVLMLLSGGLQTNGFSLARRVLAGKYAEPLGDVTVGEALLTPHRSYLETVQPLLGTDLLKGMAHVTGGGIPGNLPRILPAGLGARIHRGSWPEPEIFGLIQKAGKISDAEMFATFNMGAGFLLVVSADKLERVQQALPETAYPIGEIVSGSGATLL